jgi:hypothetical protein
MMAAIAAFRRGHWTGAHKGPAFFAYANNYLIAASLGRS